MSSIAIGWQSVGPTAGDYDREPGGDLADRLETDAPRRGDDSRPEYPQVVVASGEHGLDLAARFEVRREVIDLLAKATQVDKPFDVRRPDGAVKFDAARRSRAA